MNSSSSLTNFSSFKVLFVCGSPRRFLLFCHAERSSKLGEKQKKDEFFSFSLLFSFFFFSLLLSFLSRLDKTKTSLSQKLFFRFRLTRKEEDKQHEEDKDKDELKKKKKRARRKKKKKKKKISTTTSQNQHHKKKKKYIQYI